MTLQEQLYNFKAFNHQDANDPILLSQFGQIAQSLICNGYLQITSSNLTRQIYIDDAEFYFHEENGIGIIDPIMYHRNHPEYKIPKTEEYYFKVGELHLHQSGIDITFENKDLSFRASILIRGYRIGLDGSTDTCSTHLYSDLFKGMSIFDGISIKWVNESNPSRNLDLNYSGVRQNVMMYDGYIKTDIPCNRKWRFKIK